MQTIEFNGRIKSGTYEIDRDMVIEYVQVIAI